MTQGAPAALDDPATHAEAELVRAAIDGDSQAFAMLIKPHLGLIYRVTTRATGNLALAEDAMQETLAIVHRRLFRYRPGTSFKGFVATIAVKRARTLLRSEARRRRREELAPPGETPPTPADVAAANETARAILRALTAMPRKRQEVVLLRLDGGLGYDEIAQATDTTEGSARVLVHLGLRDLKATLAPHLETERGGRAPGERR